jgi:uncharacterized protein (DUF427 family)
MEQITLIKEAIHRPGEPRHFMEYSYPATTYVAKIGETIVAESSAVLKLSEVGYHIYDPVIYFPLADARLDLLQASDKTSHCPLKGDTNYFDFVAGQTTINDVGWCYSSTFDFAIALADYVAFDGGQVSVSAN